MNQITAQEQIKNLQDNLQQAVMEKSVADEKSADYAATIKEIRAALAGIEIGNKYALEVAATAAAEKEAADKEAADKALADKLVAKKVADRKAALRKAQKQEPVVIEQEAPDEMHIP